MVPVLKIKQTEPGLKQTVAKEPEKVTRQELFYRSPSVSHFHWHQQAVGAPHRPAQNSRVAVTGPVVKRNLSD